MGRQKQLIIKQYPALARQWHHHLNSKVYATELDSVGVSDAQPVFWQCHCAAGHVVHCSTKALTDNIKQSRPWLECPLCPRPGEVRDAARAMTRSQGCLQERRGDALGWWEGEGQNCLC